MTTIASYILDFLAKQGVEHIFGITGGAIAFVIDGFSDRKDIKFVPMLHEQAAAMAADSYARVHKSGLGATMATSGPGATNLLTGIACSYFDSIPTIHITGQVNTFDQGQKRGIRQIGFQETNIVSMATPITKFSAMLEKAEDIRYLLEKATYFAQEGRPGPVLIDIPQNLQRVNVDPKKLKGFDIPAKKEINYEKVGKVFTMLKKARKPMVLIGGGARKSIDLVERFLHQTNLPFVTSWSATDLFDNDAEGYVGNIGVYGNQGANKAIQRCDLLISIGSRLDTRQTAKGFAPRAKKVVVDIDPNEFRKGLEIDLSIEADCEEFLSNALLYDYSCENLAWLSRCQNIKYNYPVVKDEYYKQKTVNAYVFNQVLAELLPNNSYIIPDDGGNLVWTMQAFRVKYGQRLYSAFGNSPMGYAFPASIGASIALKKPIICIDGDGSFQINIQELQTIVKNKLPVKIFIMDNNGYGIIKQFQNTWLGGRHTATSEKTGVSRPDFVKVAKAYGIKPFSITENKGLVRTIRKVLKAKGPVLCNVKIAESQPLIPKVDYGNPIDKMTT